MREIEIQVELTPPGALVVTQPSMPLEDGDWVRWTFTGLTGNQYGFIRFDNRLGPFHSLRSFARASVFGKGNAGPEGRGEHPYSVFVLDPDQDDAIASAQSSLANAATQVDTSPEVLVKPVPGSRKLSISNLALHTGDTASWHFEGVPPGCFPCLEFIPTPGCPDPVTGPFQALYISNGGGGLRINGVGFGVNSSDPQFHYLLSLRDQSGNKVAHTPDPVIDNLGPPPGAGDPS